MKKIIPAAFIFLCMTACNNSSKETVEKADSINKQNSTISGGPNISSAEFLVRVANSGMAEVEVTALAQQKAENQEVKDLATMLNHDHAALNDAVKSLAALKSIILPDSMTADKKQMITDLEKKSGKDFDAAFLTAMVSAHETSIASFEKTAAEETDMEVKSFAEQTLPKLREHRDKALALQKKYFP